ncbi:hypothetical protein NADFUDRAFT_61749 [Nadsonia fulvescens var. elongata DSM 6958]|uniref:RING-type domain-containing protein n=1 Tax=Nadsonia fulvescens var. elongata DSM 6958 TaxID=857566 RepID=A0A1E3PFG7_9ASCO|nr:hypothetical protein NADFUDRAFT_61749 [Nadsonia fulvescens var. elongata DSM 6958]
MYVFSLPDEQVLEITPQYFYRTISKSSGLDPNVVAQPKGLVPRLFPYQKESLRWCLNREGKDFDKKGDLIDITQEIKNSKQVSEPPCGWRKLENFSTKNHYWVNKYTGCVCDDRTLATSLKETSNAPIGGLGLLAEEMGLGKTVEAIALILLNKRDSKEIGEQVYDFYSGRMVTKCHGTLVITPSSICQQWLKELQKHAPDLSVFFYQGRKASSITAEQLMQFDIVVTTYPVISSEFHFAHYRPDDEKEIRRRERTHISGFEGNNTPREDLRSPLIQLQFWRVLLDEVQMVTNSVTRAAKVARMVPRVHAWGVSGTPVKRDMSDLLGIMIFLRYEPFSSSTGSWDSLLRSPEDFDDLFSRMTIRHTKQMVEHNIYIPPQQRILLSIPFTEIEEDNYRNLFNTFLRQCGFDEDGRFVDRPDIIPSQETIEAGILQEMSSWLTRLRQTCGHARIGSGNQRALGGGVLKTVNQVLDGMYAQAVKNLYQDKRTVCVSKIDRGRLYETVKDPTAALEAWNDAMKEVKNCLNEIKAIVAKHEDLEISRKKIKLSVSPSLGETKEEAENIAEDDNDEMPDDDIDNNFESEETIKDYRSRMRGFLELLHRCYFFIASAHYQLGTKITENESNNIEPALTNTKGFISGNNNNLEQLKREANVSDKSSGITQFTEINNHKLKEEEYYKLAEMQRRDILSEPIAKVDKLTKGLKTKSDHKAFISIENALIHPDKFQGGIESKYFVDKLINLGEALNSQGCVIEEWRDSIVNFLSNSLIEEHKETPDGEEYGESLSAQENADAYIEVLGLVLADRSEAILGTSAPNINKNPFRKETDRSDNEHGGLQEKLMVIRNEIRPLIASSTSQPWKLIISNMRSFCTGSSYGRLVMETELVKNICNIAQKMFETQREQLTLLQKELAYLGNLFNVRVEYYRQLQTLSDNVISYEVPKEHLKNQEAYIIKQIGIQHKIEFDLGPRINRQHGRLRYLDSLKKSALTTNEDSPDDERLCVICQGGFYIGALTVCGHQFCRECFNEWWKAHATCPLCKKRLVTDEVYGFTYRAKDLEIHSSEDIDSNHHDGQTSKSIYNKPDSRIYDQLKRITLNRWYGSKIDMIVKHTIALKQKDPTTQIVIFSQWSEMLDLLAIAFKWNGVKYIDQPSQAETFKEDSSITCFILHAKSQSAGLTLVNASHVYLCEPLVNTALELQAISRIHRIGQIRTTTVWMFTMANTVEESVLKLTTKRRLNILQETSSKDINELEITDETLDVSNSNDLNQSLGQMVDNNKNNGEIVAASDLWAAFFSSKPAYDEKYNCFKS